MVLAGRAAVTTELVPEPYLTRCLPLIFFVYFLVHACFHCALIEWVPRVPKNTLHSHSFRLDRSSSPPLSLWQTATRGRLRWARPWNPLGVRSGCRHTSVLCVFYHYQESEKSDQEAVAPSHTRFDSIETSVTPLQAVDCANNLQRPCGLTDELVAKLSHGLWDEAPIEFFSIISGITEHYAVFNYLEMLLLAVFFRFVFPDAAPQSIMSCRWRRLTVATGSDHCGCEWETCSSSALLDLEGGKENNDFESLCLWRSWRSGAAVRFCLMWSLATTWERGLEAF